MSRTDDLRKRMGSAARRERQEKPSTSTTTDLPAESSEKPQVRTPNVAPKVTPYKGTFELSRPDAKRLRLVAMEHDTSVMRLVEAATVVMLDDPAVLAAAVEKAAQLAQERA